MARLSGKSIYTFYNEQIANERRSDPESWHGFSDDDNDDLPLSPPLEPLLPPPNGLFDSPDEAIRIANLWAADRGYAMVKGRTVSRKDGSLQKVWATCDRYGKPRVSILTVDKLRPNRGSIKIDCKMHAFIVEDGGKGSEKWKFTVIRGDHNHPPTTEPGSHAAIRKMYKDDEFKAKTASHRSAGMLARHTYTTYEIERPETYIIMRDLYNERDKIHREKLGHRSIMGVLVNALSEFNDRHEVTTGEFSADFQTKYDERGGPLTYLFVLHSLHRKLLMANPEVLVLDSTYRTNRYKMPLVNIIGITPCNKSFFAGSAFIPSERVLDFEYVFKTIKKVYDIAKLSYPTTFVTDGDPHVATAMHRVFPEANHILCIWHVNGNIQTRILPVIRRAYDRSDNTDIATFIDETWNAFKNDWMEAISALTETEWELRWNAFCDKYSEDYPTVIDYMTDEIIGPFKRKIVRCYTDRYIHWGVRVSSRVEAGHKDLKTELGTHRGSLLDVIEKFGNLLRRTYREICIAQEQESMKLVPRFRAEIFSLVVQKVSIFALDLVLAQYKRLHTSPGQRGPVQLPPCRGLFRKAWGLPCAHEIQRRQASKELLTLEDFHSHWYYNKNKDGDPPQSTRLELIREPEVVRPKGRPPGSLNKRRKSSKWSTERDSSQHEVVIAEVGGKGRKLKGIHAEKRLKKTTTTTTTIKKATKKVTRKRKRAEIVDLTDSSDVESQKSTEKGESTPIDDQAIKRARLERIKNSIRYMSESSDDEVINEATGEATDEAIDEATDEAIDDAFVFDDEAIDQVTDDATDEVIDEAFVFDEEVRIDSSDEEAVMEETGGNEEVIKSSVRPRRSSYARRAPKKSL
jgi:hypothetical protein